MTNLHFSIFHTSREPSFTAAPHITARTPLFRAPITSQTYPEAYPSLLGKEHAQIRAPLHLQHVEYPTATRAPSPYTHVAHCAPSHPAAPVWHIIIIGHGRGLSSLRASHVKSCATHRIPRTGAVMHSPPTGGARSGASCPQDRVLPAEGFGTRWGGVSQKYRSPTYC